MTARLSPDYRSCTAGSAVLPGLCLASAIWPEVEDVIGYGLIGGGLLATAAWWARRELRIRRRLAEIQPLPTRYIPTADQAVGEHDTTDAAMSGSSTAKVA
jgi:hypothetical protein